MDHRIKDELIEEFRDGIFALRTRRFGTVAEIMVKRLYDLAAENGIPVVGILEKQAAKYSDKRSTVKFIKKYTSIYKVRIFTTSFL